MEQRITRAKRVIAEAGRQFETPNAVDRAERLGVVAAMLYLVFNEGYSATGGDAHIRVSLCDEAIRLARLLLRLFPSEPEIMGLLALMLVQHSRRTARLDVEGEIIILDDQDRSLWDLDQIDEALVMIDKAMRHRAPGPYQIQAAIGATHARAASAQETSWAQIDRLYLILEDMAPSPVVTLNRAVAVSKISGPQAALDMIAPLADRLDAWFHFHGVRGAMLLQLKQFDEAREAFDRAIALARTPQEASHIRCHIDRLQKENSH